MNGGSGGMANFDYDKDRLGCLPIIIVAVMLWAVLVGSFYLATLCFI